jgi:hypothetical protein
MINSLKIIYYLFFSACSVIAILFFKSTQFLTLDSRNKRKITNYIFRKISLSLTDVNTRLDIKMY